MTPHERTEACAHAAAALRRDDFSCALPLVAGFDGFVDRIIDVVGARSSPDAYERLPTIAALAKRIGAAAGRSANLELVIKRTSLGGNGAILGAAAGALGARVTFIGTVGDGELDPLFAPLATHANTAVPIGAPGCTDALEFSDGKLMLGQPGSLAAITWDAVAEPLTAHIHGALLAMGNWTMTHAMTDIWRRLASDVLPNASCAGVFIDLADPAKRSDSDLLHALDAMRAMDAHAPVTLGLNEAESERVAQLAGAQPTGASLAERAQAIRQAAALSEIALHTRRAAVLATENETVEIDAPFVKEPLATTGAGDHFNAGLCAGRLLALDAPARVAMGVSCSGAFVRTGTSPAREELSAFLDAMPEPE